MIQAESFLPDVIPSLAGCPDAVAEREIETAACEFLRETGLWREEIGPIFGIPGMREYALPDVPGGRVHRVVGVRRGGEMLKAVPVADAAAGVEGSPTSFSVLATQRLRLHPTPDRSEEGAYYVDAVLVPSGRDLPEFLIDYREEVQAGALARLLAQMNTAWYSPDGAIAYRSAFDARIKAARVEAIRGHSNAPLRVKPARFV